MTIQAIRVFGPVGELGETEGYAVGDEIQHVGDVTAIIQRDTSPEPYCQISFIELWCGDHLHAEFPKQSVAAIYYLAPDVQN